MTEKPVTPSQTHRNKSANASTFDRPESSLSRGTTPQLHQKIPRPTSYTKFSLRKPSAKWNQSSSTLRFSPIKYTIPQDAKLKPYKINYYDHYKLNYPTSLTNRATDFGRGTRVNIPFAFTHKNDDAAVDAPYYQIDDMKLRRNKSNSIKKGKTIGSIYSSLVKMPHRNTVHCPQQVKANPGPNKYEVSRKAGSTTQKNTMLGRSMMFTEIRAYNTMNQPGPQNYKISEKQVRPSTARANFGYAKKSDFTHIPQKINIPAPIYDIPGFCDKFKVLKIKTCGKQ